MPDGALVLLVIDAVNAAVSSALAHAHITTDASRMEEVDAVVWVKRADVPAFPLPVHPEKTLTWYIVSPDEDFKTDAQRALDDCDWRMIRRLEQLLPADDALRVERDKLREAVTLETSHPVPSMAS